MDGEHDCDAVGPRSGPYALVPVERKWPEEIEADALSKALGLTRVRIDTIEIQPDALKVLTRRVAQQYICLPIEITPARLTLAMANPSDVLAVDAVQFASNRRVHAVVATRREILRGIDRYYPNAAARAFPEPAPRAYPEPSPRVRPEPAARVIPDPGPRVNTSEGDGAFTFFEGADTIDLDHDDCSQSTDAAAIVTLCHQILFAAIKLDASDVHVEPGPDDVRVRLRVDGVLREYVDLPGWMKAPLLSRIKVLAHLDIAQQRLPQDGRIKARSREGTLDLRVSTLPTQYGEKIVLRVLGSSRAPSLVELGMSPDQVTIVEEALHQPQGLILVTGPTGSGKSTTLYSMLTRRQAPDINIVTIEDPIERRLAGITQSQVNDKAGTTFATYLRAILRQDPDVIMVGEIRDAESAEIAFQAALTGHLVLSTLHTNGTIAAIDRLLEIGVQPFMITSVLNLVLAQRLARVVCPHCRARYDPPPAALEKLGLTASGEFIHGRGCHACGHTGYRGRIVISELLRLTPRLKKLVRKRATEAELSAAARAAGMRSLREDAVTKIREGLTTVEEVLRVIRIDDAVSVTRVRRRRITRGA